MPIGGVADTVHDAVVSIATVADAAAPELCTGVVVAPRVVLTAGHCTLASSPVLTPAPSGGGCEACPGGEKHSPLASALLLASVVFLNARRSETERKLSR